MPHPTMIEGEEQTGTKLSIFKQINQEETVVVLLFIYAHFDLYW